MIRKTIIISLVVLAAMFAIKNKDQIKRWIAGNPNNPVSQAVNTANTVGKEVANNVKMPNGQLTQYEQCVREAMTKQKDGDNSDMDVAINRCASLR